MCSETGRAYNLQQHIDMNSKPETMNDLPIHKAGRERLSHIKGFGGGLLSSEQPKSL